MNLSSILENSAARFKDKTAIVCGEQPASFASLEQDARKVARALKKMGVKKGDRVAMMQSSNPEFVTVFFGIMKVGGIAVPLDSRYVADELKILFKDCKPKVFVVEEPALKNLLPALNKFKSVKHIITVNAAPDERFTGYKEIIENYAAENIQTDVEPGDIAIISYTEGYKQNTE